MPSKRLTDRIIKHLAETKRQDLKPRSLAREMGIAEEEYGEFRDTVKALTRSGRIVQGSRRALTLPDNRGKIIGRFRANQRGFGFVIPEDPSEHGDLYVPPEGTSGAMTGDLVAARVKKQGKRDGKMMFKGVIVEIIERGQSRFVGELCKEENRWYVNPDGRTVHMPIFIDDVRAKRAKEGDQVVVEIIEYPSDNNVASGVIIDILGKSGDPGIDTMSIIIQYQLPTEFPQAVLDQAAAATANYHPKNELAKREDLTNLTIITIDPDDARDFDDAISLEVNDDGCFVLGVHIADVSHFVTMGSHIDIEARERATSIYLPDHVIPMLPEVLSNGVCSLQEKKPRLTKSVFITYDADGKVLNERFAGAVIKSTKRLTYRQASGILEGNKARFSKPVIEIVERMETLARIIEQRRLSDGMLTLDLPNVEIVLDEDGVCTGVKPEDTSYSHKIIEMFMVEANEAAARLFIDLDVPALRRIHPAPDEAAGESLARFLAPLNIKIPKTPSRRDLQRVVTNVSGKPESFTVNLAVLKSMQAAEYSPKREGHFALASEDYAHFTSPIRRYPDLTVHRLIDAYLNGTLSAAKGKENQPNYQQLESLGNHCSTNERRAEGAERELKLVLILRLLEQHLGDEFKGVVTGVTNFGVFVQLEPWLVDGLLRFEDMEDDWWEVDPDRGCVIAERSGTRIAIGDTIQVTIAQIDIPDRRLDLSIPGRRPKILQRRSSSNSPTNAPTKSKSKLEKPRKKGMNKKKTAKPKVKKRSRNRP